MSLGIKTVSILGVGLAIVAGGFWYWLTLSFKKLELPPSVPVATEKQLHAWIEIQTPHVFTANDANKKELHNGDEILKGDTIQSDATSHATLHFPDGSLVRVQPDTKITLTEETFNKDSGTLTMRLRLWTGRVWCKVVNLATPNSLWEVKTSNAIAAVRGTAFGVEFKNGISRVMVTEHKVSVGIIDPKTERVLREEVVIVTTNTFMSIGDQQVSAMAASEKVLVPQPMTPTMLKENWVQESKKADEQLDKKLQNLTPVESKSNSNKLQKSDRDMIRKEMFLKPLEEIQQLRDKKVTEPVSEPTVAPSTEKVSPAPVASSVQPKSLAIQAITAVPLVGVIEGTPISLTATLSMSDGTKRNVTASAEWSVDGPIGKIIKPGVFIPELGNAVSELGEGDGTINASWKNQATGEILHAKLPLKVQGKVDTDINPGG